MKTTRYFDFMRQRPDRAQIRLEWIERAMTGAEKKEIQADMRIRLWIRVPEAENRWLRVVLLPDGQTVHNAFFDRSVKEK